MRWSTIFVGAVALAGGCSAGGTATVHALMVNGPSPAAKQAGSRGSPFAGGPWSITPTFVHAPISELWFDTTTSPVIVSLDSCALDFDLTKPGATPQSTCDFELPAGTYYSVEVTEPSLDLLIDDSYNGLYTDPASPVNLDTSPPPGGARPITVGGSPGYGVGIPLATTLVVRDRDDITLTMFMDALQGLEVTYSDENVPPSLYFNLGPKVLVAVGSVTAIDYYVNPDLGTPYSFLDAQETPRLGIAVAYGDQWAPTFVALNFFTDLNPIPCGLSEYAMPGRRTGYLGRDSNNVLGWADVNQVEIATMPGWTGSDYLALLRLPEAASLGDAVQLDCLNTSSDPKPPGGSFASGAPEIATPTYSTTMTLVGN
jgi:hypothetical protein